MNVISCFPPNQNLFSNIVIAVKPIHTAKEMEQAFEIRRKVFVIEQKVDPAEEYDEFEEACIHFIATHNNIPAGTARIRKTDKGVKLERFAVLQEYRNKTVGKLLVYAALAHPWTLEKNVYLYMHAQEHAVEFYKKLGFKVEGERFMECDIPHFTMSKYS